jgi:hypothetical protein
MKLMYGLMVLCFAIFGCENTERKVDDTEQDSLLQNKPVDSLGANVNIENAPEWFTSVQNDQNKIFAPGYGKSRRADIAEEKAMMDAQQRMAELIKNEATEAIIKYELEQIAPFQIRQKKRVQVDDQWHVYLLIEKSKE